MMNSPPPPPQQPLPPPQPQGPPLADKLKDGLNESVRQVQNIASNTAASVEALADKMRVGVASIGEQAKQGVSTTGEMIAGFFNANTLITKFAFIMLVVIAFLILVKIGITMIDYFSRQPTNPYLIKGMIVSTNNYTITRNAALANSVELARSNNRKTGMEFTWSVWLNVGSLAISANPPQYNHVFSVGGNTANPDTGILGVGNAPGVYFTSVKDGVRGGSITLHAVMDTEPFKTTNGWSDNLVGHSKSVDITEMPYNKWFHVALRLENKVLDVYVNGTIAGRINFETVPRQNYYDVQICQNGGFQGNLSNLQYFPSALNVFDIGAIVSAGPSVNAPKITGSSYQPAETTALAGYDYISNWWFFNKL